MTPPVDAELTLALVAALADHFGRPCSVTRLDRRPSAYRTSHAVEELDVTLADGARLELVFKNLTRAALSDTARRVKPIFLDDPRREIMVYRNVLAPAGLGTAGYYGAALDPAADRYWLFLERVPGVGLFQVGEFEVWKRAARWLAGLHTRFAADIDRLAKEARLLDYDADFFRLWPRRAIEFARDGKARRELMHLAGRYEPVIERLAALPRTVIHGEFYASNVLSAGTRICPVDWELAAAGPGLIDLAALAAGTWTADQRAALAAAYREAAGMPGGGDFDAALTCCRLHLAIQWLGWSADWTPPADHAHDWLGEALRLAGELHL